MKIQHLHIFSQARLRLLIGLPAAVSLVVGLGAPAIVGAEGSKKDSFEVWLVDQSNTNGLTHGGTVYIYDGEDVTGQNASSATPTDVINLSAETSALCLLATGANPVRPHMLMFNQAETHALLAFVASGHVVIFNAQTRQPVACLRTELGAGAARQAHQVIATGDDQFLLVTNQNGKKLERIRTDYTNNVFTQEPGATLNLATCTTPNGLPCQDPTLRPDNAPVFVFNQSATDPAWVNLRGGGILVADWRTMPMSIIGEYDKTHLPVDGGMFGQAKGRVFGTGGAPNQFTVYRLPVSGYAASNPPNTPAPEILLDDNSPGRDAHGVEATKHDRYIWVDDRAGNVIEVFDSQTGADTSTFDLRSEFSSDPTPDLITKSPDRKWFFISTRGPNPLSGDPHAAQGSDPGMLIVRVKGGGKKGKVEGLVRISNIDSAGIERADGHGIRARSNNPDYETDPDLSNSAAN